MIRRLSEKEEALMQIVWELKHAFAREVREAMPEPKLHINTVATMMRRLADKGFLQVEEFGSNHRYAAVLSKNDYTTRFVKPLLAGLFGNSIKNAVSFFAEQEEITTDELKEIIKMIENKKQ